MLLATDWPARDVTAGVVSGGCAVSGLFDLLPLTATTINDPLQLNAGRAAALSPLNLTVPGRLLRTYVGESEGPEFMGQSRSIAEAWDGRFDVVPGADHFAVIAPLTEPRSNLIAAIRADIRDVADRS